MNYKATVIGNVESEDVGIIGIRDNKEVFRVDVERMHEGWRNTLEKEIVK